MAYIPFLMLEESIEESENRIDMFINGNKPSKQKYECNKCPPRYMPNCCVSCLRKDECSCKKKSLWAK